MNFPFPNLIEIKGGFSNKKIFRQNKKKINKIVIDFSKDQKEFQKFLNVYEILKKINVSIPKIYEVYFKKKIIVMEDYGDKTFDKLLNNKDLYYLLKIAIDNIIIIQNSLISTDLTKLEQYSFKDLKTEISEFVDYYIPYKNILDFPVNEFYDFWETMYSKQRFEFKSFVHKDFEFINLMFLSKNNSHLKCGIIDFQSAFLGFIGWDLFSILENPRINFSRQYNEELIKYFYENISTNIDFDVFHRQYYLLNLARQTRLLGRWIKLYIKEDKIEYLSYVETSLIRIIASLNKIQSNKLNTIYKKALII